jgi:hypothetical protein
MKSLLLAAIAAAAALSQTALAAPLAPSGIVADLLSGNWPASTELEDTLFEPIGIDTATYPLDEARLDSVREAFGGTTQHAVADNGAPLDWLCYQHNDIRTWFLSWGDFDKGGGVLTSLIAEETIAADAPEAGCRTVDDVFVPVAGNGIPGVGATLADLKSRFGIAEPDKDGKVSYFNQATVAEDGNSWTMTKNVYYLIKNGIVVSVAFSAFMGGA